VLDEFFLLLNDAGNPVIEDDNADGTNVVHLRSDIVVRPVEPSGQCPTTTPSFEGVRSQGTLEIWIDHATGYPIRSFADIEIYQGEVLLVHQHFYAEYSLFNKAQLPSPIPG
jgi:hypothetical protein